MFTISSNISLLFSSHLFTSKCFINIFSFFLNLKKSICTRHEFAISHKSEPLDIHADVVYIILFWTIPFLRRLLAKYTIIRCCVWYNELYQCAKQFQYVGTQIWLSKNLTLPEDLKSWLNFNLQDREMMWYVCSYLIF